MNFRNLSASVQTLLAKGMSISQINAKILDCTVDDIKDWKTALGRLGKINSDFNQNNIATCLQRWKNGTSLGGNDGGTYGNNNNAFPTNPRIVPPLQEYYVPNQSSSGRILIDGSGRAYFYANHYSPPATPIPFDVLLSLLG
jgi:hypothetical protein